MLRSYGNKCDATAIDLFAAPHQQTLVDALRTSNLTKRKGKEKKTCSTQLKCGRRTVLNFYNLNNRFFYTKKILKLLDYDRLRYISKIRYPKAEY